MPYHFNGNIPSWWWTGTIYNWSKALSAADLTLLSLAEVVLGPVWVWLFLGELASNNTFIGGGVLLLAIITNAVSGKRWQPPPIM